MTWSLRIRLILRILREFRTPFFLLVFVMLAGGTIIHFAKKLSISNSIFAAFAASFFEIVFSPPYPWYLLCFLYLAPIVGLYFVADGIAVGAGLLFGKRRKLQRWWEMIASIYSNHVVVCGVGKVGYRIINELRNLNVPVVGIDNDLSTSFAQELLDQGVPLIQGNVRVKSVLERANIAQARAVLCVTSDDLNNLDCAFTAREIKPNVRVVVRLFDDNLAKKMSTHFDFPVISTSYAAAPSFASAALDLGLSHTQMTIYGQTAQFNLLQVDAKLSEMSIAQVEQRDHIKIVGYQDPEGNERFPSPDLRLQQGAQLMVLRTERA